MLCRPLWLHLDVGGWSSQTWETCHTWETYVWWSFRNGCTILCYGPTSPSVCLIWYPKLWLCVSVHALDKNDMIATSKTTFELLYGICYWYALKHFIRHWQAPKCFIWYWYAPKHFIRLWYAPKCFICYCYASKCSICSWYAPEHFICYWYAPITLCSICYESNMFWMTWYIWICI